MSRWRAASGSGSSRSRAASGEARGVDGQRAHMRPRRPLVLLGGLTAGSTSEVREDEQLLDLLLGEQPLGLGEQPL
eukprot:6745489-Pyramimonas_sp.AAC.1